MKAKKISFILCFLSAGRQCPATSYEAGLQYMVALDSKHCNYKCFLFLLLSLSFYGWADFIWCGIFLWSVWFRYPHCVPSRITPKLLVMRECWRDGADSVPVPLRCTQNTDCYQYLSSHQCEAQHCEGYYREKTPSQKDSIHFQVRNNSFGPGLWQLAGGKWLFVKTEENLKNADTIKAQCRVNLHTTWEKYN